MRNIKKEREHGMGWVRKAARQTDQDEPDTQKLKSQIMMVERLNGRIENKIDRCDNVHVMHNLTSAQGRKLEGLRRKWVAVHESNCSALAELEEKLSDYCDAWFSQNSANRALEIFAMNVAPRF